MKRFLPLLKIALVGVALTSGLTGCSMTGTGLIGKTRPADQPSHWHQHWDRATASK